MVHQFSNRALNCWCMWMLASLSVHCVNAQSVCLPAPRLLTIFPMGAKAGTSVQVVLSGENLDDLSELIFADPRIKAQPIHDPQQPKVHKFEVNVPAEVQPGIVEAYVLARLGVSSSRVFAVGQLEELSYSQSGSTPREAQPISLGSTVNANMTARSANHYSFTASTGQLLRIDCQARGIDSKADPVVVLLNSLGRVLATDRQGAGITMKVPEDGQYVIKVHDLTFQGGPEFFYRLSLRTGDEPAKFTEFASTRHVSQYSWPPDGFDPGVSLPEGEPNESKQAQVITLPAQLRGSFYPAADVDCYEFQATQGQQWWIEIASHRLSAPTGPAALVQRQVNQDGQLRWEDLLELKDIAPPLKVSSNNYAYDGPPYNGGSTDLIGMLTIPEDGRYRILLSDLFGGTRDDPNCTYELVIRAARPDYALTGWAKHIELRNGDRNALSKPLALRPGATVALEIGAFRRDGMNAPIRLQVQGLPDGVTASAVDIPADQTTGTLLLTADIRAPRTLGFLKIFGVAEVQGQTVERTCQIASMAWPIRDHWQEFPQPRLSTTVPISVTSAEPAPLTIESPADANGQSLIRCVVGTTVKVPLQLQRHCELSGALLRLNTLGQGFQNNPRFEIPLQEDRAEILLDLAKLKIAAGTYAVSFYGPVVAKYRDNPDAVTAAQKHKDNAQSRCDQLQRQLQLLASQSSSTASDLAEQQLDQSNQSAAAEKMQLEQELKAVQSELSAADQALQAATARSQPTDIADIVVSRPVILEVGIAEEK